MSDIADLRDRLVGARFYDTANDETCTVVHVLETPPLALLQYDDGTAWDEAASPFVLDEETAHRTGMDEDGLDSERYEPLGPGPQVDQICAPDAHDWFP